MLTTNHNIQIGSDTWASAENSRLIALRSESSLQVPVNHCTFRFTHPDGVSASVGDDISIKLGHSDDLEKIFTGQVSQINWHLDSVEIHATSSFRFLVQKQVNSYFDQPTASDMVNTLAKEAGVKTGTVDSGINFSHYVVGDQFSIYDHLKHLAIQCGVDFYADEEDKLIFGKSTSFLPHDFQFGINVLKLVLTQPEEVVSKVMVLGESPASHGQGSDASNWLTKTDVSGSGGGGSGITRYIADPTARTTENAGSIAKNWQQHYDTRYAGQITTLGKPDIRLGEEIKLSAMQLSKQEGTFKVVGIQHRIHPRKGFLTVIDFAEIPS